MSNAQFYSTTSAGKNERYINVRDYGAKGDGIADDSASIQEAINVAALEGGCGRVFIPSGTWKCNIVIPRWIEVFGARPLGRVEAFVGTEQTGTGFTILIPNSNTTAVIKITDCLGPVIRNLRIDGPGAYTASSIGIRVAKDNGNFAGTGLHMDGVEVRDFETGVLYLANRGYFTHCSFMSCVYGFKAQTSADGLPSDSITFINCSGGGARQTSAGVWQSVGSRTNYGWHLNGNIKGAGFYGCEMGQCGTAIRIEECLGVVVSASNFEGNDTGAITMTSGHLVVEGSNSFSDALPLVRASSTYNITSVSIRNCVVSTTAPGIIRLEDQNLIPSITPPALVEYVNSSNTQLGLVSSEGELLQATRITSDQTVNPGNSPVAIIWNSVAGRYTGNFNTTKGEWKCPRAGRYRFRLRVKTGGIGTWSEWYLVGSTTSEGSAADGGFVVKRIDSLNSYDYIVGETQLFCTQGWYYRLFTNSGSATSYTISVGSDAATGAPECQWIIQEIK